MARLPSESTLALWSRTVVLMALIGLTPGIALAQCTGQCPPCNNAYPGGAPVGHGQSHQRILMNVWD